MNGTLKIIYWLAVALVAVIGGIAGCAGVGTQSPPGQVQAYFVAAHEADLRGIQQMSPQSQDLSAYSHLMGVKYPPTQTVEVLNGPPARPYRAFAVLQDPAGESETTIHVEELKNKAREIGADAIILCQAGQGLPGLPPCDHKTALAIKYRLETRKGGTRTY